jgi:hypothetical protein
VKRQLGSSHLTPFIALFICQRDRDKRSGIGLHLPLKRSYLRRTHHPDSPFLFLGRKRHHAPNALSERKNHLGSIRLIDPDGESSYWQMEGSLIKLGSMPSLHKVDRDMRVFWRLVHRFTLFSCSSFFRWLNCHEKKCTIKRKICLLGFLLLIFSSSIHLKCVRDRLCVKSSAFIVLCACLKPLLRLAVGQNMLQSGGRN